MDRFTSSLRSSVAHGDWYAALALALSLPDICGKIEEPGLKSQARYALWFENWLAHLYTRPVGHDRAMYKFMSGDDLYALRCSYLHQGDAELSGPAQEVRNILDSFEFVQPRPGVIKHMNEGGRQLQLQVSVFCEEMADAVDAWYLARKDEPRIADAVSKLLRIYESYGREISY